MVPKWARATLKWEGNIRKREEAAEIALTRPADNRKARKNQANAEPRWNALSLTRWKTPSS